MTKRRTVSILVFDDVEVLDFCGPFEVFSLAGRDRDPTPFNVILVAEKRQPVIARNGLSVNPDATIDDAPDSEIILVPGGYGTRPLMKNEAMIDWIKRSSEGAELVLSVCTGALLLGVAGLLDGLRATTHHAAHELLETTVPGCTVERDKRVVDNGRIVLSAGISAGIDMSFHVVARLLGKEAALSTAQWMEYDWKPDAEFEATYS